MQWAYKQNSFELRLLPGASPKVLILVEFGNEDCH